MEDSIDLFSYLIFAVSLGLIGGCILLDIPLYYGFLASVAFSIVMLQKKGYELKSLINMVFEGVKDCSILLAIITLIGATVSMWLASGVVPALMYYGFEYVKHTNFLLASFLITSGISVVMGSAVGTVSTIGIALLGIGKGFEIPEQVVLGTVISGAFVADRISPISGLVNLMLKTTELQYRDYVKSMLKTLIPSLAIASAIYYFMGRGYLSQISPERISMYQENIGQAFVISPWLLILPILIITLAVLGSKSLVNLSIGVAGGILISIFVQGRSVAEVIRFIFTGYESNTGILELDAIIKGGGIGPMVEVLLIVAGAVALSSLLEGTNIINPIIASVVDKARSKASLIMRTALFSSFLTIVTCDQTAGIILLGRLLQKKFKELKVDRVKLARTISDTGSTIAPLIPWNINAIIILAVTGIAALEYAPFAVLCYLAPVVTVISGRFREDR